MFCFDSNMFSNYCRLKIDPFGIQIMSYVNILLAFLVRRKMCSLFFGVGEIDHVVIADRTAAHPDARFDRIKDAMQTRKIDHELV